MTKAQLFGGKPLHRIEQSGQLDTRDVRILNLACLTAKWSITMETKKGLGTGPLQSALNITASCHVFLVALGATKSRSAAK